MNKVEKAENALSEFLKDNPEMQEYQDEINRIMTKVPGSKERMEVLKFMMVERLDKLKRILDGLQQIVREVSENVS